MISTKRLRSAIHSTAHHAVSGLSYVHPHLGLACKKMGLKSISVDLLKSGFEPKLDTMTDELKLSARALRKKFAEILNSEKIELNEISEAHALFQFHHRGRWPSGCYIGVVTNEGKRVEIAVDSVGKVAEVLDARP